MKSLATLLTILAQLGFAGCSRAADVMTQCNEKQLLGDVPGENEQEAHRKFSLPKIIYRHGQGLGRHAEWGFWLQLRVDAAGRVVCYSTEEPFGDEFELNAQRRGLLAQLREWRYEPFVRNGKAVDMIVAERIREEEAPAAHRPLPEVPLEQVQISLERTSCYGACPSYKVDVHGDGRVVYSGEEHVDVVGEHAYRIAPEQVAKLVESLRSKDIWSLREEYRAGITDSPTYMLTLRFGKQVRELEDYVGEAIGMPKSVSDFEDEVDRWSEAAGFVHLSRDAVKRLEAEKFDFRSQAGADLLARAVSNRRSRDNQAMLSLIELGAPVAGGKGSEWSFSGEYRSLLEQALIGQRMELIEPLIQRGALETNGAPDQSKIDAAFQAAVMGGRLGPVERIWSIAGARPHPSLTFEDVSDDQQRTRKTAPVAVLLRRPERFDGPWEGFEITQWLMARGCDIKGAGADKDTLLHIAASAGDVEWVRYLLNQGFDPSIPGRHDLTALDGTRSEDVALLLLEAGADVSKLDDSGQHFRGFAHANHWARVIAWLDAH